VAIAKSLIDLLVKGLTVPPSSAFTHGGREATNLFDNTTGGGAYDGVMNYLKVLEGFTDQGPNAVVPYAKGGPLAPNGQPIEQLYLPVARDKIAANKAIDDEFKELFGALDEYDENGFVKLTPEIAEGTAPAATVKMADGSSLEATIKAAKEAEARHAAEEAARKAEKVTKRRVQGEMDAEQVLSMLRSGRADEVNRYMFPNADTPALQDQAFNEYLFKNYDLPMDAASRAERAKAMGYGDQTWFRGSNSNSAVPRADHIFAADDPDVANTYVGRDGGNIAPLRFQQTPRDVNVSPQAEDTRWSSIPTDNSTAITRRDGMIINPETVRESGSDYTTTDTVIRRLADNGFMSRTEPNAVTFEGIVDLGGAQEYMGKNAEGASNVIATPSKKGIRSQFARFDPRLAHIENIMAGFGGAGALGFGALGGAGQAEASAAPPQDVQAKLLGSINEYVKNAPKRPAAETQALAEQFGVQSGADPLDRAAAGYAPVRPGMATPKTSTMMGDGSVVAPYEPTTREGIGIDIEAALEGLGMDPYMAREYAQRTMGTGGGVGVADLVPFLGSGLGLEEAERAFGQGRYLDAALDAGGAALGAIPLAGPAIREGVQGLKAFGVDEFGGVPLSFGPDMRRVSTRLPTAVKATENPYREALSIDFPSATAGDVGRHNIGLLQHTPGFAKLTGMSPEEAAKTYVDQSVGNLGFLIDRMTPEQINSTRQWYEGANRFSKALAGRAGLKPESVSGAMAMLSPQKDWFQNASLGERLVDVVTNRSKMTATPEMRDAIERIPAFATPLAGKQPLPRDLQEQLLGVPFGEIDDPLLKAMWARAYDEAHNPRAYRELTPEGMLGDFVKTKGGAEQKVAWGSFNEIGKALQSLDSDGDMDLISRLLGQQHKVRSFYNNIFDPMEELGKFGDVTGDTHAVAAGQMRPLSGASTQVLQNFGSAPMVTKRPDDWRPTKSSAVTGVQGTYGINTEPVRKIAEERGLRPREAQSVTWEAIRALFEAAAKRGSGVGRADDLWRLHDAGKLSLEETRKAIFDAFGGFGSPTWGQSRSGLLSPENGASSFRR
jgi:hypothetical protein